LAAALISIKALFLFRAPWPGCRAHGSHQPGDLFFPLQPFNGSTVHVTEG
jgi:hypothetical protein